MTTVRRGLTPFLDLRTALAVFGLAACGIAAADQTEDNTTVPGTEDPDVISVLTDEEADALIASVLAEISKASATVIGSLAGRDTITINASLDATSSIGTVILTNPGKSESASTSTVVAAGGGPDTIESSGTQTATATSTAAYGEILGIDDSIVDSESQQADVSIKSTAESTGIDSGAGNDTITTSSELTSTATATTGGVAAGIQGSFSDSTSIQAESVAESEASGIRAGAGDDVVTNSGTVAANATATSGVIAVDVNAADGNDAERKVQGELAASAKAEAESVGIDTDGAKTKTKTSRKEDEADDGQRVTKTRTRTLESGSDTVTNSGSITSIATATSDSVGVGVNAAAQGSLKATVDADATATSRGISTGAGDDSVTNTGSITAGSNATAWAAGTSISAGQGEDEDEAAKGKTQTTTDAKSVARSIGVDADGPASSTSTFEESFQGRSSLSETKTTSETAATGTDVVQNAGTIGVNSIASAGSRAVSIQVNAEGTAKADAEATAKAQGIGVNAGGGNDVVLNDGAITASADATASALAISFDQGGEKAKSNADAKVTADAAATGIAGDGNAVDESTSYSLTIDLTGLRIVETSQETTQHGDDTLVNSETVGATATALTGAAGAAIAIDGSASSDMTSKATATATAIDAGGGNDLASNQGTLTADADATAGALSIGFAQKVSEEEEAEAEVEVKASVDAIASATGLAGDSGKDVSTSYELSIGLDGLDREVQLTEGVLGGNDQLFNTGTITATATTLAGAAGVAVTIDGASSAEINSNASSQAAGIDAGGGNDLVDSSGAVTATATSTTGALAIAFAQKPDDKDDASTETSAEAKATATGIAGDSGSQTVTTKTIHIGLDGIEATASREVTANSGDDIITATGDVTATASATSLTLGVTVTIDGTAKSEMKATAESEAAGIVGGGGNDDVESGGVVTASATSFAGGIAVAVGQQSSDDSKAKTKVSAETEAKANATGIATDGGQGDTLLSGSLAIDLSGLQFDFEQSTTAAVGDDSLVNDGAVNATALANTAAAAVAVTIKGGAQADVDSEAEAIARGLDSGGGSDSIDNGGTLTTSATANAITANVSVSTDGSATSNVGLLNGGTEVKTDAVGISSAGSEHQKSIVIAQQIEFTGFAVTGSVEVAEDGVSGDGNDLVLNSGVVTTTSTATSLAADVGVSGNGTALTLGRSESESHAGGIESGNGDDRVENSGALTSTATANAALANVSVTSKGTAVAGNAAWDGGTKATATAAGIDADSGKIESTLVEFEASAERAQVVYLKSETGASGNDVVFNDGDILAESFARAATASVAVSPKGVAAAVSTSTAEAESFGIRGGDGDDQIQNTAHVTATADSLAATANVSVTAGSGVSVAADAVWDGGTTAEAKAIGIAGDGGNQSETTRLAIGTDEMGFDKDEVLASGADTILNFGVVDAEADAFAASAGVAVTGSSGVAVATATSTAEATATAIDAGAGSEVDIVYNGGILNADANADAASASVSVVNTGVALAADSVWDGGTGATARARGIDVGAGGETIQNDGQAHATATAFAGSVSTAVTMTGFAGGSATSTGEADATAIDASAGDDSDTVFSHGALSSTANATAASVSISFTNAGASVAAGAVWDGGTGATARSRGIDVGNGADVVLNTGSIDSSADSLAADAAVSIAVTGVAGAIATATADTTATAIDTGADTAADVVENTGELTVDSNAKAFSAAVAVTTAGLSLAADDFWDGGTEAHALARGIDTGGGADSILNTGAIGIDSDGVTAAASVSVAVSGAAGATARSTGTSDATAIDAGGDDADDVIENSGDLTVTSDAFAAAVSVGFTTAGVAVGGTWDSGTTSDATARGIGAGEGADSIENEGVIDVFAGSATGVVDVSVAVTGVAAAVSAQSDSRSLAIGIDAGEAAFEDTVINHGRIEAEASSLGASASIGVSGAGVGAAWNGGILGDATARGIATGDGADGVENTAVVDATATAGTAAAAISVTVTGVGGAVATSDAVADATGIHTGDDDADDLVLNSGAVTAESDALAASAAVSVSMGVSIAGGDPFDGGTRAEAEARGFELGGGADTLVNSGTVTADAAATTAGVTVAVDLVGVAGAISTSTAETDAYAIDAGDGDDRIDNAADLFAISDATAVTVNIAVAAGAAGASDNIWDGGTTGTATAAAIRGGGGADEITSNAGITIDSHAMADSYSIAAAVAGGFSVALSKSTSNATATGIEAGDGDDILLTASDVTGRAESTAASVSAAISFSGLAAAGGSTWDGGTTANSDAFGVTLGGGADEALNTGSIAASANSEATSVAVALMPTPGAGVAIADAVSTADAAATAMAGDDGADTIVNEGLLSAEADADAFGLNIAFSTVGAAGSGLSTLLDNGTRSFATSSGMTGGAGEDGLRNAESGTMTLHSDASTSVASVSLALLGVSAAGSHATATAGGAGIDGGADDDTLINDGTLSAGAFAHGLGGAISFSAFAGLAEANSTGEALLNGLVGGDGDDWVENAGSVALTAHADAVGVSVGGAPAGFALASANADAIVDARGMTGGAGTDTIVNSGGITVNGDATTIARSIAASAAGYSLSQANTNSTVTTAGLDGGEGDDQIVNEEEGSIAISSFARTDSGGVGVTLFGAAEGAARTLPRSFATGMAGGGGDDEMLNAGLLTVLSRSESFATGGGAVLAGFASADTGIEAEVFATGMAGDAGDDLLVNTGDIRVGPAADATGDDAWMSVLDSNGFSAGLAGSTVTESVSAARTTSAGMSGGIGDDTLSNDGSLVVIANALSRSTGSTLAIFGSAGTNSESGAITVATGLEGGEGDDYVETLDELSVSATSALLKQDGSTTFTLAGTNDSDSGLTARTEARGLTGGAGTDTLVTEGLVTVTARSTLSASGGSTTIAGTASAAGSSGAITSAAGIDAGAGDDVVVSDADFIVDATSQLSMSSSSYTFGGESDAGGSLTASTTVDGILGGAGDDTIVNTGSFVLDARSELSSSNGSDTTFGGSAASTDSGARSNAGGIAGGEGDDHIENAEEGSIDVAAVARLTTNAVTYSFVGSSGSNVAMTGAANAYGLQGHSGDNTVLNAGELSVVADVSLVASGGSKTTITGTGGGQSGGSTRSDAAAVGLAAEGGADTLSSTGTLSVHAISQAETANSSNTEASLISDSGAQSGATAFAIARGFSAGEGDNTIQSAGNVTVRADSNAYSLAFADGASISLAGHARSDIGSEATAEATGIEAGGGGNVVLIDGILDVTAEADTAKTISVTAAIQTFDGAGDPETVQPISTDIDVTSDIELPELADDGDIVNGDYIFWTQTTPDPDEPQDPPPHDDPNVGPEGAYYQAERSETTDDEGNVTVTWAWVPAPVFIVERTTELANFPSAAGAAGHGIDGDGRSFANGRATARAWGVRLGDGDNVVENAGSIFVTADANASLQASASGGATGDAEARTTSTGEAFAYGALFGAGNNRLTNSGTIDVEAIATATAIADADAGDGVCIPFIFWTWCIAPGSTTSVPVANRFAGAVGVLTGDGDNVIINEAGAVIAVRAEATGAASLGAAGIVTGSGDDIVINEGMVSATTIQGGVVTAQVGIDTGAGNDQLTLGDASEVIGTVAVGEGDDAVTLVGTPEVHDGFLNSFDLSGGAGSDTLNLSGPGSFAGDAFDFERAVKIGSGTYGLPSLATVQELAIDGGVLQLGSDYSFAPDGSFETYIHSDGDRGQFLVMGEVLVDGAISVERRGDDYINDGTRYTVVDATGAVGGAFTDITLPESRPLLSFELEQSDSTVDIVANAPNFSVVAGNRLHREVADNLYGLSGGATGDLAGHLGTLQNMDDGFDRAFASLAPDSYDVLTVHSITVGHETAQLLRAHLSDARAFRRGDRPATAAYAPVSLSLAGGDLRVVDVGAQGAFHGMAAAGRAGSAARSNQRRSVTWTSAFLSSGDYDLADGFTEYDYDARGFVIGADRFFGESVIAGFMVSFADASIDEVEAVASADVETWTGSLYATRHWDRMYVEGGIAYSTQQFDNRRSLTIGPDELEAASRHDGTMLMAFASAGREFDLGSWQVEPYASLYYFDVDEDAFAEEGAGSLNQLYENKSTSALLGEAGARFVRLQALRKGTLDWHAVLAYNHDFDLDDGAIAYAYQGEPDSPLFVTDRQAASGSPVLGAGVAYVRDRSTLSLDYRGQFNSDYRNGILGLRLALSF